LDAFKISELNCYKMIPQLTAAGLQYGLFRRKELNDQNRYVLFIDIGCSHTSIGIIYFKSDEISMVKQTHLLNIGGRNFDEIL